jgi:hypothetical protein
LIELGTTKINQETGVRNPVRRANRPELPDCNVLGDRHRLPVQAQPLGVEALRQQRLFLKPEQIPAVSAARRRIKRLGGGAQNPFPAVGCIQGTGVHAPHLGVGALHEVQEALAVR